MYLLYVVEYVSNCYCKYDIFYVNFKYFNWDCSILFKYNLFLKYEICLIKIGSDFFFIYVYEYVYVYIYVYVCIFKF